MQRIWFQCKNPEKWGFSNENFYRSESSWLTIVKHGFPQRFDYQTRPFFLLINGCSAYNKGLGNVFYVGIWVFKSDKEGKKKTFKQSTIYYDFVQQKDSAIRDEPHILTISIGN